MQNLHKIHAEPTTYYKLIQNLQKIQTVLIPTQNSDSPNTYTNSNSSNKHITPKIRENTKSASIKYSPS